METSARTVEKGHRTNNREALINAGVAEINRKGLNGFSMRHAAEVCGVSCAAPAKHFGDKNGFIAAIIKKIIKQWHDIQRGIVEQSGGDIRKALVESGVEYVKFLVENPHFISIITVKDDDFTSIYRDLRFELSYATGRMVLKYCKQVGMPIEVRERKLYVVRSLIYGAALMFDNKEMRYNESNLQYVREMID
ncbi:MAG: TetR/AcrR family transcriptional regulator, partial [Bacillota bacterium]|nr:TetR/AcrR family transcriptional regulator [Bacillota bacterium]